MLFKYLLRHLVFYDLRSIVLVLHIAKYTLTKHVRTIKHFL